MKRAARIVLIILLSCCALFPGCNKYPSEQPEQPEPTEAAFTKEELLPDWKIDRESIEGFTVYRGKTTKELREYLETMTRKGFTLLENTSRRYGEGNNGARVLYRDGIWVEISDNTHSRRASERGCGIRIFFETRTAGLDKAAAAALIGTGGMENEPLDIIELTAEGVYEKTGIQLFKCLFELPEGSEPPYVINTYLVSKEEWRRIKAYDYLAADIDGNGKEDVVLVDIGKSGGGSNVFDFAVLDASKGKLKVIAESCYLYYPFVYHRLTAHDGKVFLAAAQILSSENGLPVLGEEKEFEIRVKKGEVVIEDPQNELGLTEAPWFKEERFDY